MSNSIDYSAFGPRVMQYVDAAKRENSYIHNENGTVNKANLSGLKCKVPPVQTPAPKKHSQLDTTKDTVAVSSEARDNSSESASVKNFAAAWG